MSTQLKLEKISKGTTQQKSVYEQHNENQKGKNCNTKKTFFS